MNPSKPRVIKDYEKLDPEIQEKIKLEYPSGYSENLIYFNNKEGKRVSALPFETEDKYYLVRMTVYEAEKIIEDDDDYDSTGSLKDSAKEEYESKYSDDEFLSTETEAEEVADVADDNYDDDDDFDEEGADED
ncbi:MAG: hypothetical protein Q8K69_09175 [Bacteroidota bacterium]|jgi:hypothetical protein|nr:hypothetical protein [Bacteroidota bacterium]MDP3433991.1 hypothetical protein [Bacteroidota bacterium]MDP3913413.1 hypothetical protein [Bacteroidota bacterium]